MLDAKKCCLVLIDVQEKLLRVMQNPDGLVKHCGILIQIAKALNIPILWCQQYPKALGLTAGPLTELLNGLSPMDKLSFSCGGAPGFAERLEALNTEAAVLCGIESHVCVFQTAMDILHQGLKVHVIADAVGSRTEENRQIGLSRMAAAGAVISSTEMFLFELLRTAEHPKFKELAALIR
ncbi:MAG: hydrolase [Planctomycetes bacterium]|nr:hydrolase [Planctomycetota bacterium]